MKKLMYNRTKLKALITVVLLMATTFLVIANVAVQAQDELEIQANGSVRLPSGVTPDVSIKTIACLSFRPNPVGVDQTILVNMWISPALHRSRYHTDYKVTIEDPSGNPYVITMDSYHADATAWFEYLFDKVGTWRLKFEFPGGYFPAGIYIDPRNNQEVTFPGSCYYEPSSTDWQELVVQEELVLSWPPSPLPTDYWTRPVPFEHREWTSILGDFPWRGPGGGSDWPENTNKYWDTRYNFIPYVQGPNTSHIIWKRIGAIGGLVGAGQGYDALTSGSGGPEAIYQGKCYDLVTLPGGESGLQCYDLRTGEMYWEISPSPLPSGTSLVGIEYTGLTSLAVPGATEQARAGASLVALGSTTLAKINPWTGAVTSDVSIVSGRHSYYHNGYVLTCQDLGSGAEPDRYRLVNWTTFGSSSDFDSRIVSNITWPFTRSLSPGMAFDFEAGYAANTGPYARPAGPGDTDVTPPEVGATIRVRITSASVETGEVKWSELVDITPFDAMQAYCADHGKIAVVLQDGTWRAYDLETGDLAWVSERMDYPWDATGFGSYGAASAYGLLLRFAYSGIYAFDWTNGEIAWKYEATAPDQYETPYYGRNNTVVYPFDGTGWIADKKVYAINTEHTPTAPITRGWGVHCVDAMTGDLIWKMTMPSGGVGGGITGTPGGISAIVDGYMVVSSLEGYMYVFGKGKSEATVTASPKTVAKGSQVLIEGTVLDQSSAQSGTPCVSKESMTTQMEYLHMQFPIGGIEGDAVITGVPVSLSAVDESGNHVEVGTTTTNGYFGTFAYAWTPPDEGTYEIIATFAGDDSYGSSGAATAITVGPAAEEVDLAPLEGDVSDLGSSVDNLESGMSNLTTYIIVVLVIAIIALVIGLYLALRSRK